MAAATGLDFLCALTHVPVIERRKWKKGKTADVISRSENRPGPTCDDGRLLVSSIIAGRSERSRQERLKAPDAGARMLPNRSTWA
jgi:hypothetical protein